MAEPREKAWSSNFGSVLDRMVNQAAGSLSGALSDAPSQDGGTSALAALGIDIDPSLISAQSIDPVTGQPMGQAPTVEELLLGTSMDVSGRYALTGSRYDFSTLPLWAQSVGKAAFAGNPNLDPYLGIVNQQGDERVFLGDAEMKVPSYWDEVDDKLAVNAKDEKKRGKAREENLRIDRANKVERQLGEDPSQQVAGTKKQKGDATATSTQVKNQPYLWEDEQVADAMRKMRLAGLPVKIFDDMVSVWGKMVDRAATTYSLSAGQRKITPWDVLDMYKSEAKASGAYTNYEKAMNGTSTTVSKSVSEITEGQAWSALQSQLSNLLGRDPKDEELRDFAVKMNSLAARNPSITKTITRYKNGEAVSSNSHTSGGFTADDMVHAAYEDAQNDPQYAEYQAATTYYNAALQALGALGDG